MKRILRVVTIAAVAFVALALSIEVALGLFQPVLEPDEEAVLRTFDEDGTVHETRLVVIKDGDTLWLQSAHHWRGWYDRVLANPEVELIQDDVSTPYLAVPLDTPETETRIERLLSQRIGSMLYLIRALQLGADVKPIRLDPRSVESSD
jgi:hypothetical protein